MHDNAKKLLKLMFREGETICVSNSKYGYHAIPLENASVDPVTLLSPNPDVPMQFVPSNTLNLVALNPIKGFREDINCTAFRNFLVEMDTGPLAQQMAYIRASGMPYSAVMFSGNKSLHFLISLDKDVPNEETWRILSEWTLNVVPLADPNTKNPSRSIRIPDAIREADKMQRLVEFKGPVNFSEFAAWLQKWPSAKPFIREKRTVTADGGEFDRVKKWVPFALAKGLNPTKGRNKQWFAIACEYALAGYSEDDTLDKLSRWFNPDRDFKEREWKTTIKSAFKYIYDRK